MYVNEEQLIRQAQNGNQHAFTQLYDQHFDKVFRYIYVRLKNQAESEDLTQEVFIKAINAIGSYKYEGAPFASWLFRIAHNQVIDFVRKRDKQKTTSLDEALSYAGNDDPVTETEYRYEVAELTIAIEQLSPAQREVVSLRFIAELTIAEVAKILGKSEGTIKALQFNATASLRKLMGAR